jgi:uncharacterized membrane protein YoaK (UPF0700 family)
LIQDAPFLLGSNGGYVDTCGFLALNGLFTAHVVGGFLDVAGAGRLELLDS